MPDYPTVLEIVKQNDALLLLVVMICAVVTLAFLVARSTPHLNFIYWYHHPPLLYLPRIGMLSFSLEFILFIGLLLRLPLLTGSLWNDEAVTARLMQLPLETIPRAILMDTHPPLYYNLLYSWTDLVGSNPVMLRFPSLLLSLMCIYLVYRLARGLNLSHSAGLWSSVLVATLPAAIQFGTEARSYMLLTFLVMMGVLAILERRRWSLTFVLGSLLWTHNFGILYMAGLIVGGFVFNWHERRRWLLPIAAGTMVSLLWLPFFLIQSQLVVDGFWAYFSFGAIARAFFNMTVGSINILLVAPLTMITVISVWKLRSWLKTKHGLLWLSVVFIPVLLSIVISLAWHPVFVFRHFLPVMMIFIVLWGNLLSRSRSAGLVLLPTLALSLVFFYSSGIHTARPDYRGLIAEHCSEADSFYATSINSAFITLANDDRPTLTWRAAVDNGLTLTQSALPHFGIQTGLLSDLQGQTVCIMQIERPETSQNERLMLSFIQVMHPVRSTIVPLGKLNYLVFHMVEL